MYVPSVCISPSCICPLRLYILWCIYFLNIYVPSLYRFLLCVSRYLCPLCVYVFSSVWTPVSLSLITFNNPPIPPRLRFSSTTHLFFSLHSTTHLFSSISNYKCLLSHIFNKPHVFFPFHSHSTTYLYPSSQITFHNLPILSSLRFYSTIHLFSSISDYMWLLSHIFNNPRFLSPLRSHSTTYLSPPFLITFNNLPIHSSLRFHSTTPCHFD